MWDQEKKHLEKFNEILAENRVRPTALLPLWNIAGFLLGWYQKYKARFITSLDKYPAFRTKHMHKE